MGETVDEPFAIRSLPLTLNFIGVLIWDIGQPGTRSECQAGTIFGWQIDRYTARDMVQTVLRLGYQYETMGT